MLTLAILNLNFDCALLDWTIMNKGLDIVNVIIKSTNGTTNKGFNVGDRVSWSETIPNRGSNGDAVMGSASAVVRMCAKNQKWQVENEVKKSLEANTSGCKEGCEREDSNSQQTMQEGSS